jgi:tetratricopeptide (TPR) repeat protein
VDLASAYNNLGNLLQQTRVDEAEQWHLKARDLRKQIYLRNPRLAASAADLAVSYENLAGLYQTSGRPDRAREMLREAVEVREILVRECPKVGHYAHRLNTVYLNLARLEGEAHRPAEAVSLCRQALAVAQPLAAAHADIVEYQTSLGMVFFVLGTQLAETKNFDEGVTRCSQAIETLEAVLKRYPRDDPSRAVLRAAYITRASSYQANGQAGPALADLARSWMLAAPSATDKSKRGGK